MNKQKSELDFYYLSKDNKEQRVRKKKHPKKNPKKKNPEPMNDNMFNIDKEIVIGVTVLPQKGKRKDAKNKNSQKNNKKNNKKKKSIEKKTTRTVQTKTRIPNNVKYDDFDVTDTKSNYKKSGQAKKKNVKRISYEENKRRREEREKKFRIAKVILKILLFIGIIIGVFIFLFMSPVFELKNIIVQGNNKVSTDEIKSLSKLNLDENIFRFSIKDTQEKIKENAYINTVIVKREFPDKVKIEVSERVAKYQIEFGNAYIYIDEDGNMLEISEQNANLPIIKGCSTNQEMYKAGNKLQEEDCNRLKEVAKILNASKSNGIYDIIANIDISNNQEFKIDMPTKGKIAYLGDGSNINDKMLILKEILNKEDGKNGEVFINDINKIFFREKV